MAHEGKLTALAIAKAKKPGRYGDGKGLYLQVAKGGTRSWVFRYQPAGHLSRNGKPLTREMGLSSFGTFTLAEARDLARQQRQLVAAGIDPIAERKAKRQGEAAAARKATTFKQCAADLIEARRVEWGNAKHAAQWESTLQKYAYPVLGDLSVAEIDKALVIKALDPFGARSRKPRAGYAVGSRRS